jgi:hypothetical protein
MTINLRSIITSSLSQTSDMKLPENFLLLIWKPLQVQWNAFISASSVYNGLEGTELYLEFIFFKHWGTR